MRKRLFWPALVTLAGLVVLIGLGAWQWRRMGEKAALIATIADRAGREAVALPPAADWSQLDLARLAYQPIQTTGVFDHTKETHVFFSLAKPVNGFGGPGYLIVTPLMLEDGSSVLVNRGFVPAERKEAATRAEGQVSGPQTITGLARLAETRNSFTPADDAQKNVFYTRDPVSIAKAKGLSRVAPLIIDLKSPAPPGRLPQPGVTQIDIPNNHFQYAITWWSLAGVMAAIFLMVARNREP